MTGLTDGICNFENPNLGITWNDLFPLRVDDNRQYMEADRNLKRRILSKRVG